MKILCSFKSNMSSLNMGTQTLAEALMLRNWGFDVKGIEAMTEALVFRAVFVW